MRDITGSIIDSFMGSYGEGNGVFSGAPNAITYKVPWNSAEGEAGFGDITFTTSSSVPTAFENRPYSLCLLPMISY